MFNYRTAIAIQQEKQHRFSREAERDQRAKQAQGQRLGVVGRLLKRVSRRPIRKLAAFLAAVAIAVTAVTASASQSEPETQVKEVQVVEQSNASTSEADPIEAPESKGPESEKKLLGGLLGPLTKE